MAPALPPDSGMPLVTLKIMSYNVQGHADRFLSGYLDRIAEVITAERPDIVGLQEVHRATCGPRLVDQAEEIARRTGLDVRFGASYGRNGREFGNAVLSAGAVGETTIHPLPGGSEPRTLLQTRVAVRGVELDVYVTHFSAWGRLGRKARVLQANHLVGLLQHARPPFVLVGDLNASPETPELRHLLATTLFRSCGELVCTSPAHAQLPRLRLRRPGLDRARDARAAGRPVRPLAGGGRAAARDPHAGGGRRCEHRSLGRSDPGPRPGRLTRFTGEPA